MVGDGLADQQTSAGVWIGEETPSVVKLRVDLHQGSGEALLRLVQIACAEALLDLPLPDDLAEFLRHLDADAIDAV
jgi:hypothetical protein